MAGWESDTFSLQQAGWQLSAEQSFGRGTMRIAMHHQGMNLRALTEVTEFDYMHAAHDWNDYLRGVVLHCGMMGREINIHMHGEVSPSAFQPIDATPQVFMERRIVKIEDLAHFAAPLVRSQEIILPEENVPELLERILKLQQPARTERIREELRHPEGRMFDPKPRQKFHAQIISLAA